LGPKSHQACLEALRGPIALENPPLKLILISRTEKTKDGKHYIVNGTKKWITVVDNFYPLKTNSLTRPKNGVFCDYFVTGVKTGVFPPLEVVLGLLLIEL
jgi:hypothetical protein